MPQKILFGIIGLFIGILINYLADVLPIKRRISQPLCRYCHEPQNAFHFFLYPRKCQHCNKFRGFRTILVEIIAIWLAVWLFNNTGDIYEYIWSLILTFYFGLVLVIDLEYKLILHPVSIFGAVIGFVFGWVYHGLLVTLLGAVIGFLLMYVLYYIGGLFTKFMSRRRGEPIDEIALGFGDVILSTVLGLILGWQGIFACILLAVILGGIGSLAYILWMVLARRYKAFEAIPYGPFLVISAFLLLYADKFLMRIM